MMRGCGALSSPQFPDSFPKRFAERRTQLKKRQHTGRPKAGRARLGALLAGALSYPARASASAIDTMNRAQGFLLDLVGTVGVCFIAFGVITLAISFQSHDDSQRSKAIMSIIGGAIAVSVRVVLDILGVAHQ